MNATVQSLAAANHLSLERYYRRHARVYDATRWVYLFGRGNLLQLLEQGPAPAQVLEVGCGTGRNLARLARRFPQAAFTGVDLSAAMLRQAQRRSRGAAARFNWVRAVYDRPLRPARPFDLVLFSYSLSMMNPGWDAALQTAAGELAPGGRVAVVDFHQTPLPWFRRWMQQHQLRMDGHLLPALCKQFRPRLAARQPAYYGAWEYFLFLGANRAAANSPRA
jgi:S-adenosylmethionine-diacylgycerolhomoserine-N-methlytransferase